MWVYLFIGFYLGFLIGLVVEFLRRDIAEARDREKKEASLEARGLREYVVYEISAETDLFECPTCGAYLSFAGDE
jgi:hypothetical protein